MADLRPDEAAWLGGILGSVLRAEARRAARGDCTRCGHPDSAHRRQKLGTTRDGRDIIAIGCPPEKKGDYDA